MQQPLDTQDICYIVKKKMKAVKFLIFLIVYIIVGSVSNSHTDLFNATRNENLA